MLVVRRDARSADGVMVSPRDIGCAVFGYCYQAAVAGGVPGVDQDAQRLPLLKRPGPQHLPRRHIRASPAAALPDAESVRKRWPSRS